ncbi:MAG: hypothetical protein MHM6MM_007126, partial [Cercozoa sp. M6MM]
MKPCRYWESGHCARGADCSYEHLQHARSDAPPSKPIRKKLCKNWASGNCPFGANCSFEHPMKRVESTERPCRYWASGSCAKGDLCSFKHAAHRVGAGSDTSPSDLATKKSCGGWEAGNSAKGADYLFEQRATPDSKAASCSKPKKKKPCSQHSQDFFDKIKCIAATGKWKNIRTLGERLAKLGREYSACETADHIHLAADMLCQRLQSQNQRPVSIFAVLAMIGDCGAIASIMDVPSLPDWTRFVTNLDWEELCSTKATIKKDLGRALFRKALEGLRIAAELHRAHGSFEYVVILTFHQLSLSSKHSVNGSTLEAFFDDFRFMVSNSASTATAHMCALAAAFLSQAPSPKALLHVLENAPLAEVDSSIVEWLKECSPPQHDSDRDALASALRLTPTVEVVRVMLARKLLHGHRQAEVLEAVAAECGSTDVIKQLKRQFAHEFDAVDRPTVSQFKKAVNAVRGFFSLSFFEQHVPSFVSEFTKSESWPSCPLQALEFLASVCTQHRNGPDIVDRALIKHICDRSAPQLTKNATAVKVVRLATTTLTASVARLIHSGVLQRCLPDEPTLEDLLQSATVILAIEKTGSCDLSMCVRVINDAKSDLLDARTNVKQVRAILKKRLFLIQLLKRFDMEDYGKLLENTAIRMDKEESALKHLQHFVQVFCSVGTIDVSKLNETASHLLHVFVDMELGELLAELNEIDQIWPSWRVETNWLHSFKHSHLLSHVWRTSLEAARCDENEVLSTDQVINLLPAVRSRVVSWSNDICSLDIPVEHLRVLFSDLSNEFYEREVRLMLNVLLDAKFELEEPVVSLEKRILQHLCSFAFVEEMQRWLPGLLKLRLSLDNELFRCSVDEDEFYETLCQVQKIVESDEASRLHSMTDIENFLRKVYMGMSSMQLEFLEALAEAPGLTSWLAVHTHDYHELVEVVRPCAKEAVVLDGLAALNKVHAILLPVFRNAPFASYQTMLECVATSDVRETDVCSLHTVMTCWKILVDLFTRQTRSPIAKCIADLRELWTRGAFRMSTHSLQIVL